jgi:hypothetical protein
MRSVKIVETEENSLLKTDQIIFTQLKYTAHHILKTCSLRIHDQLLNNSISNDYTDGKTVL